MLISLLLLFISLTSQKLLFVYEHSRHGNRGPGFGGPGANPPNKENKDAFRIKWDGNGEITNIGIRMHYLLGVALREKYDNFLSKVYNPNEILVISTNMSRTLMSIQAQLQGLYPPIKENQISPSEIKLSIPPINKTSALEKEISDLSTLTPPRLQTVPINIIDNDEIDALLMKTNFCGTYMTKKVFRRYDPELLEYYDTLNKTYGKQLMNFLGKNSTDFIWDYRYIFSLADTFLSDYSNNKDLSELESYGIDLELFKNLSMQMKRHFLFHGEYTQEIASMALTKSIPKIIQWMDTTIDIDGGKKVQRRHRPPKFVMYSMHDKTIGAFELFMEKVFGTPVLFPYYASTLFFELHRKDESLNKKPTIDDYYVEYHFNEKKLLKVPYKEFKEKTLINLATKAEVEAYCDTSVMPSMEKIIIGFFLFFVVVMCLIYFFVRVLKGEKKMKNKCKTSSDYEMVLKN